MALKLDMKKSPFGRRTFSQTLRTDIFKIFNSNISIIQAVGVPQGDQDEGSIFLNNYDRKLYIGTSFKTSNTPDLVWMKFNGTAQDFSSGTKYSGTETGTPAYSAGKYDKAIDFDGVDDLVTIPATMPFDLSADWTISFWVQPYALASNQKAFILERYKDADEYFQIQLFSTGVTGSLRWRNGGAEDSSTITNLDPSVWNFVHLSYDASGTNLRKVTWNSVVGWNVANDTSLTLPDIAFTTELYEIGHSEEEGDFGEPFSLDSFKIFSETRDGATATGSTPTETLDPINFIDSYDLDKVNWLEWQGIPAQNT